MNDKQFEEFIEKLRDLNVFFRKQTSEERWAFLYLAFAMVKGLDEEK